ncbi:MAG: ribonuclease III [Mycoplasmatales bacterium]
MDNILRVYEEYNFASLEKKIGINFEDKELLIKAFTHGSFNKYNFENYQRLEFLGDAILQMSVSDYMYRQQNKDSEGLMSKQRGALVSEFSLAFVVRKEELNKYIIFGKSLKKTEVNNTNSYIADIYEALVAAIYLDKGYLVADNFIKKTLIERKDQILEHDILQDYKTLLQERLQINGSINIKYLTDTSLKNGEFKSQVILEDAIIGTGIGKTKKLAEQQAAKNALNNMVE